VASLQVENTGIAAVNPECGMEYLALLMERSMAGALTAKQIQGAVTEANAMMVGVDE
jgi:hypothetical protein